MNLHRNTLESENKGTLVNKLSLQDSSLEALAAKVSVAWLGFFAGVSLSDIFTLASIIYVLLNIFVLVRDKIFHASPHRRSTDSQPQNQRDSDTPSGE